MFWFLVLSTVFLGVGVIVCILTRDSFRASRVYRDASSAVTSKNSEAQSINAMIREERDVPPPSHAAALFSGQHDRETDDLADSLAQVKDNPMLPTAPRAYLRLEERDESLEHLLIRRGRRSEDKARVSPPPREFSIEVTEQDPDRRRTGS